MVYFVLSSEHRVTVAASTFLQPGAFRLRVQHMVDTVNGLRAEVLW